MRPDGDDWLGVELRGVYDGISIYVYPDGRLVNRWDTEDWRGSTRWQQTEDYLDQHRDELIALTTRIYESHDGAQGDDDQRDAGGAG